MEVKKKSKNRIIIALIVVLLAAGGAVAYAYATAQVRPGQAPAVHLGRLETAGSQGDFDEQDADTPPTGAYAPVHSTWYEPLLGGLLKKKQQTTGPVESVDLGTITVKRLPLAIDFGGEGNASDGQAPFYTATWTLLQGDGIAFEGTPAQYEDFTFAYNGDYEGRLKVEVAATETSSAASYDYRFTFTLDVQARVVFSTDRALQGDILAVYANTGFSNQRPAIQTELGRAVFLPLSPDEYIAYLPVNFDQPVGKWEVVVDLDGQQVEEGIIVTKRIYGEQHMTISKDTVDATMNNPLGPKNWEERIKVLWDTYDEQKYWTDTFLMPCEGRISTAFGLYRYTNENPVAVRHTGIDIAVPRGTPVAASNSGRVVRAEDIIYTGYTVVIEHGGGLKTYYYHLDTMEVEEGDQVDRGQVVGTVGSTGYSTGPHLHFEVKMGSHSLSPWELFDGSSEAYHFDEPGWLAGER